ncbi:MAG TPA: right-handed parallel beta-helix repeat-containing protein [Pyrinomonadaceae bacterium]|nr:right-handed parallel beta-helix repeat-containing protein [Pyrinomonadaceae bacterium]
MTIQKLISGAATYTVSVVFVIALTISCVNGVLAQGGRSVSADRYPGTDLGAKINAADKALGPGKGEIVVSGGGTISTQIVLSSDHVLRFQPGTYVSRTNTIPIVMKPRSSVVGSGWDAIITESNLPEQFTVISAYNHSVHNGSADNGLVIRDIQIKGANPGFNSAYQAISLGNCSNCLVDKVWINGTRAIGIQLGGAGDSGNLAENSKVTNCQFTRVASQNLALTNGRNIVFEGNRFITSGQVGGPGNTNIDLEPNSPLDHLVNVLVRNNFIDVRNSEAHTTGSGIIAQTGAATRIGPIIIENNTIIGGSDEGAITNILSNGIAVYGDNMKDVIIRNNTIRRTGQSGIRVQGARIVVTNNKLADVGGGGIPGFYVATFDSEITNNSITSKGQQPIDNRMIVHKDSRRNVIRNNPGWIVTPE